MNISSEQANLIIPHVVMCYKLQQNLLTVGPLVFGFASFSKFSILVRFNDYVALRDKLRANDYVGKYELILEFSLIESFVFNKLWFYWLIVLYIVVLELLNDFNGQS
ncbi:unnamed protein product [Rhizophagus irregularis]|nr:unnamed protein product [Rhizophagus irregularis]